MQTDIEHIREIEVVSQQGSGSRDPVVVQSWLRCLDKHGLDPSARAEAYILPDAALRQHRQRSEDLIRIARSGIDDLYQLVAGQNYVLLLSDGEGVTVEYLGEETQKAQLRRAGLYLGAEWSEARAGTCALGACIETGEPLIIHQSDHFDVTHGNLSCTAAPIYDTTGGLAAVLDISLLASPLARTSQMLALNLVRQTARRIEMANIMSEARADWVLRLADSPDFLDVDPQAALRLDHGGHVIGMTHGAARLMARSLGQDWRRGPGLIGRHVSEVFNLDLGALEQLTRQHLARDRLIETRDGHRLFAHAIEPQRRRLPATRPLPQPLPAGLRDLAGDDPVLRQIAQRAATLAQSRQPLLICGPIGSGTSAFARAIHDAGSRGPFITVPCETIAEDEAAILFGRAEARGVTLGLIEAAQGGTLVLDHLEELPPRLQARLVTLFHESSFRPVGALRERSSTARLIVTTRSAGAEGLRDDLLHRVSGSSLALPPLAARQDLVALALRLFSRALGMSVQCDPEVAAALAAAEWRGNLHELESLAAALAGSVAQGPGGMICLSLADLPPHLQQTQGDPRRDDAAVLTHMLALHGGNISAVARALNLDRSTIHRRIQRHGLARPH